MATVIITGVDVALLEEQRKVLAGVDCKDMAQPQLDALNGLLNMLDDWSDNNQDVINYHKAKQ